MIGGSTGWSKTSHANQGYPAPMRVSIIIPALNEERSIAATVTAVKALQPYELIVVDGGSTDDTCKTCQRLGVTALLSPPGRGTQMNHGARQATGDVLLFLHADTRLPGSALEDIIGALRKPHCIGGRFDVELDGAHWMFRVIGAMINLRSRISKVATGDQAIFVRRDIFAELGGYPNMALMEDVAFSRALKRRGPVVCLGSRVVTSARRWEAEGIWRTMVKMWTVKLLYFLGISPLHLKRFYADTR